MANIQINKGVFMGIKILLDELQDNPNSPLIRTLTAHLKKEVDKKYEAIQKRDTFTKYKTAQVGSDEHESYRKEYLEMIGLHEEWRTGVEVGKDEL